MNPYGTVQRGDYKQKAASCVAMFPKQVHLVWKFVYGVFEVYESFAYRYTTRVIPRYPTY